MRCVYLILCLAAVSGQQSDLFELNIIHYNDFHAHFDQMSASGTVCVPDGDPCVGGIARLSTAIKEAFEAEPDSLLLNGGDNFQGTVWYNFLKWNVTQHFLNMFEHDAYVLGNHEFDDGIEGLVPFLERIRAPMLAANVNTTFEPIMAPLLQNHHIVTRRGRSIGIIGVLLQSFTAPIGNLIIEDEVTAVNREAAILTEQGVDIIIVLSHIGYDSDIAMASRLSSDVDIIVGAHSHSLLYNGVSPGGETVRGDYPTVVTQSNGHQIPIVQAYCYTGYLGNIKLFINDAGIVESWEGLPVYLGSTVVQDPVMLAELEPWREEVDAVGKEVLGWSAVSLARGCYTSECNLGDWVCDGFLDQVMSRAAEGAWGGAHVCMVNAGGLRNQIDRGNISTEVLLMAMPFENYLQVFSLTGAHLLEALEFSVGVFQSNPTSFYSGRMLQYGGLRVVFNATAPVGSRVQSALVRCLECSIPRYEPLDTSAVYRVVAQNYIGDGGSGFSVLSENRFDLETLEVDYIYLQNYLRKQQIVVQELDGRIQIVY